MIAAARSAEFPVLALIAQDPAAELLYDRPARLLHQLPRNTGEPPSPFEEEHHLVDLRQILQQFLSVIIHGASFLFLFILGENTFLLLYPAAQCKEQNGIINQVIRTFVKKDEIKAL